MKERARFRILFGSLFEGIIQDPHPHPRQEISGCFFEQKSLLFLLSRVRVG
jgi:hypothetical protein